MSEQPREPAFHERAGLFFAAAFVCALVVLGATMVTAQPRLLIIGAGALGGTWSAWRAMQLWRAQGRRGPMAAAAALCGFLGSALMLFLVVLTMVVLRGGAF